MNWRRLPALFVLLAGTVTTLASATAGIDDFSPSDWAKLNGYAKQTWRSFEALTLPTGLPADSLTWSKDGKFQTAPLTSPSDIAAYLWSTMAAEDLKIIAGDEAADRMGRTLATLVKLDRSHGFFYNWYDPRDGSALKVWPGGGPVRPFLSTVDNGWLAVSLMMVRNARPAFRDVADNLLAAMNFGFFYDPFDPQNPVAHPGLLRGGFYADDNTYAGYHYGMLNTEARIASYVAIARNQVPADHYYRMSRSRPHRSEGQSITCKGQVRSYLGVAVDEGYNTYRGLRVVPSWDGSMFEAMMVPLFIPEADWGPESWGVNHRLYVRASIENALEDSHLAAWGASPSSIPTGGYRVYGVTPLSVDGRDVEAAKESVVTPHASFLALQFAPREALRNADLLKNQFQAYGSHGFLDAVDVRTGRISDTELSLDQGMIMAAVANALGNGCMQKAFCDDKVTDALRPLMAREQFSSGVETAQAELVPPATNALPAPVRGWLSGSLRGERGVAREVRDLVSSGLNSPATSQILAGLHLALSH